ncbi:MAG TPA: sigma 54-interacting transcriptional regulator [Bryobacteraceae bacterium]|jgi:transcriptional regulator with GAF, ATPase, and Fis domain
MDGSQAERTGAAPKAWFRSFGCGESTEAGVKAGLEAAGIQLVACGESDAQELFGIVAFEQIAGEVFDVLHAARRSGRARVIALALPPGESAPPVWRLLHAGAADTLIWGEASATASQIRAKLERWSAIDTLAAEASVGESLIGESPAWLASVRQAVESAYYTRAPILLTGDSGTGKEMLARLINAVTRNGDSLGEPRRELVTVDCGALVPELSGSELFGHERGAFTGAHAAREGAFALADGATLFLDEIGDVPPPIQVQLLRAIQEGSYKRVGGNTWQNARFRLVCATNRNLEELVRRGRFRLDLYYRIAGCILRPPPLKERKEDILPLAVHFLRKMLPVAPGFSEQVQEYLVNRHYPGNVRELQQLIHRIALRHTGDGPVTAGEIPEEDRPSGGELQRAWPDEKFEQSVADAVALGASLKEIGQTTTQVAIRIAVQSENGNLQRAARRLGITDRALQMRKAAGQLE